MSAELIHQMYIAYYQRPADPGGHQYWLNRVNSEGWDAISAEFITGAEATALYGNDTAQQKLAKMITAAFGRDPEAGEVDALIAGNATANLGQLAANFSPSGLQIGSK